MAATPSFRPGSSSGAGPRTAQSKLEARLQDACDQRYLYMVPGYYYHNDHFYAQTSGLDAGGARGPTLDATLRQGSIVLLRMNSWSKDAVALIARRDTGSAVFEPRLSNNPDRGRPLGAQKLYSDWTLLSNPFNLDGSQILQACGLFMDGIQGFLPATHKLRVVPAPSTDNTPRAQTPASYKLAGTRATTSPYASALDFSESSKLALGFTLEHPAQLAAALEEPSSGSQRSLSKDSVGTFGHRSSIQSLNNSRNGSGAPSIVSGSNRGSVLAQSSGTGTPRVSSGGSPVNANHSRSSSAAPSRNSGTGMRGTSPANVLSRSDDVGSSAGHRSAPLSRQQSTGDLTRQTSGTMRSTPALPSSPSWGNASRERRNSFNGSRSHGTISGGRAPWNHGSPIFEARQTVHIPSPSVQSSQTSTRHSSRSGGPAESEQRPFSRPFSSAHSNASAEGSPDRVGRFERTERGNAASPSPGVDRRLLTPSQTRPTIAQQVRAELDRTRGWKSPESTGLGSSTRARSSPNRGPVRLQGGRQRASPSPLAASSIAATTTNLAATASQYASNLAQSQNVATAKTALSTGFQNVSGYFKNGRWGR